VVAVRSVNGVWIAYASWFVWRFLTRFPEDTAFADSVEVHHHEASA
jgi:hypothetical protein